MNALLNIFPKRFLSSASALSTAFIASTLVVMTTGCGVVPSAVAPKSTKSERAPQETATTYWETLNQISNGSATQQADVFYEAERDYTSAPTTANTLRYALALAAPAHPATDAVRGKKLLEQLLANPERLTSTERSIAAFLVKDAEIRLQLEAENRRLAATVDERSRGQANFDRRTQVLAEENAKLRKQLDDAQRKLDAIKSIERSIIERSQPTTPATGSRDVPNPNPPQSPPSGR